MTTGTFYAHSPDKLAARLIFDPVLGWRRRPGTSIEKLDPLHRTLVIGPNGFRVIPNQPCSYSRRIWVFGCSCTEGQWLEDENTYCYQLQQRFPDWRIDAFGIGGYSNFQNLLQLEANLVTERPDVVLFTFIPGHSARNVAHPELWRPIMTGGHQRWGLGLGKTLKTFRPAARLNHRGELIYHRVRPPQSRQAYDAMIAYGPDKFYQDLIMARIMFRARDLAASVGAEFHFTVLWSPESVSRDGCGSPGHLDNDPLIIRLRAGGINVIDADPRLSFDQTTFRPIDGHPNATANTHFANAIGSALESSE